MNDTKRISELVGNVEKLHSAPAVAQRVLEITRDDYFEIRDVVDCLEHDPALAASILRLVNSSHFGLSSKLLSVQQAVTYLGRRSLRLTVLSFGIIDGLMRSAPSVLFETFWRRALTVAVAARICARELRLDCESAFTTGLFCDLGVLVLAQYDPKNYPRMYMDHAHDHELIDAEQNQYGCDHMTLGAELLRRWSFPDELTEAVRDHHVVPSDSPSLHQLAYTASLLAEVLWDPDSRRVPEVQSIVAEVFQGDTDKLIDLAIECKSAYAKALESFSVSLPGEMDPDTLRERAREQFRKAAIDASIELDGIEAVAETHGF